MKRYGRPRIRQIIADDGTRTWIRAVECRCGWCGLASGWRAASRLGDWHWRTWHRAAWKRAA